MSTWVCSACHTYNPVSSGQCMACGREPGIESTVHRAPAAPPDPTGEIVRDSAAESRQSFPWPIVAAAVAAVVLIAGVAGIVLARSPKKDDPSKVTAAAAPSSSSSTTTTTAMPSTTTTTIAPVVVPPTRATAPPTTAAPRVVGNTCPSGPGTEAAVHIHTGSTLNFRDRAGSKVSLDRASNGDRLRFWADPNLLSFDSATLRSWVPAELPNHPGRCGYTSASNITMASDTYSSIGYETDCDTFEGGVVAVQLCTAEDVTTMKVVWKARGSAPDDLGTMTRDGVGLATAQRGDDLYTLDIHELRVTRNGAELVTADIRDNN